MEVIAKLHREAMAFADDAQMARFRGDTDAAKQAAHQAFVKEREAARGAAEFNLEPTKSVLHRSAATLALECGELREAEKLIATALAGDPPMEIAEELRDLLETVNQQRHLALRGVSLMENEFQMAIEGAAVGFGVAPAEFVINRVRDLEALLHRSAQRQSGRAFCENWRKAPGRKNYSVYMGVPRAASYAVTFRFGVGQQQSLPGYNFSEEVIEDVLDCIELVSQGNSKALRERIPDDSYYKNFVSLAKKLAPDGKELKTVGFTASGKTGLRMVALSGSRKQLFSTILLPQDDDLGAVVEIQGTLLSADATGKRTGHVEVVEKNKRSHGLKVPRGMMSDIVKPMFEEEVLVIAKKTRTGLILVDIDLVGM